MGYLSDFLIFILILMKRGEVVVLMCLCTATSPSFIKIEIERKSFINSPFFVFLVHLFSYSLIFAYSLLNDLALNLDNALHKHMTI